MKVLMDLTLTGQRIKASRKKHRITQEQLAEASNVSPHYIYEIERGSKTMSIYTLSDIANALDESVDYLLFGDIYPNIGRRQPDRLSLMIETLPAKKREIAADVLAVILPHLNG